MPEPTESDRELMDRADGVLGEHSATDTASMSDRIAVLEWHLGEVLRLARRLAGD